MSSPRQNEICRFLMKDKLRRSGIPVGSEVDREIGNLIKNLKVLGLNPPATKQELVELFLDLSRDLISDVAKRNGCGEDEPRTMTDSAV